jgi:hypothetical protein
VLAGAAVPARVRAGRAEQNFRRFESDNEGHGPASDTDRIFASLRLPPSQLLKLDGSRYLRGFGSDAARARSR